MKAPVEIGGGLLIYVNFVVVEQDRQSKNGREQVQSNKKAAIGRFFY